MRKDIAFKTHGGVMLCDWQYRPDKRSGKRPKIVMADGYSAVKQMYLDQFAETFAVAEGIGSILLDTTVATRPRRSP